MHHILPHPAVPYGIVLDLIIYHSLIKYSVVFTQKRRALLQDSFKLVKNKITQVRIDSKKANQLLSKIMTFDLLFYIDFIRQTTNVELNANSGRIK